MPTPGFFLIWPPRLIGFELMSSKRIKDQRSKDKRLKVGVTLFIRDEQQSLWENGIFQNCYFLLQLLNASPMVESTFIVNGGPADPAKCGNFLRSAPAPVITYAEAMDELDLIIELSAQLNAEWTTQFKAKGGKAIGMHVANDFVIDTERMSFDLPHGSLMAPVPYDEVWTLPAFAKTCGAYYSTGFRAPVRVMPHLWSSALIDQAQRDRGEQPLSYQPGRARWRLAILEPNICTVKTCHLPMLLCDMAYRKNPRAIEIMRVFNALKLKDHHTFIGYAKSLDIVQQGLASFDGRQPIFEVMKNHADAVVSHHWENGQNYIYYEMLHGGFPLIHNSDFLNGCGYRYDSYDPEDGALALLQAFASHDRDLATYRKTADRFVATLDPLHPANIRAFETAIQGVMESVRQP